MTSTAPMPPFVLLVGIDESSSTKLVIQRAAALARAIPRSEIHLLHVVDMGARGVSGPDVVEVVERRRASLDAHAREAREASGVTVVGHLASGEPARVILQAAASVDADLIVVGTRDRQGVERWLLGSVSQSVTQRASCPVLVVREKNHQALHAPEIEPPCPDCLAKQRGSAGASLWCARHATHHPHAHLHYEAVGSYGAGSNLIRPSESR
jgi:nucleotide-binding universal stress UspA family protein